MKRLLSCVVLALLVSCGSRTQNTNEKPSKAKVKAETAEKKKTITKAVEKATVPEKPKIPKITGPALSFKKETKRAFVIGQAVAQYGEDLKPLVTRNDLDGRPVRVLAVSDSLYSHEGKEADICNAFNLVQVGLADEKIWLDGRNVYRVDADTSFVVGGKDFTVWRTLYYGIDVAHEGELVGCFSRKPMVLEVPASDYFGLVKEERTEFTTGSPYPYFELLSDEGNLDDIVGVEPGADSISFTFKLKRTYMEGGARISLKVSPTEKGGYSARIKSLEEYQEGS
ncbi:hypothetical protein FUAX_30150 [Fulvitalea axinellae]|uniref:Lipoprotein n=1 Tax=Fulvitalea axinellae TaxID=1182444 RepID=A0AAU9D3P4_9BACT|nr:hypothetical protein FUAX_30150 [Fulvitalea axinellae]